MKSSDRWFDDQELDQMGRRTLDVLHEAIDSGDVQEAKRIAQRMHNEFLSMHDAYRNWVTSLLTEVGERWGDEALETVMIETVESWWLPNLAAMAERTDDLRIKAKMFAAGLRGHLQPMTVEEDEEKIVMKMRPCGSGGRLILEGKYEGENAFLKIQKPQKITYGRPDFPVYCAHEAAMEQVDIEHNGRPFVVVEPADRLGDEPCSFIIYKDPDAIPDKYYSRLGLKNPDSATHDRGLESAAD